SSEKRYSERLVGDLLRPAAEVAVSPDDVLVVIGRIERGCAVSAGRRRLVAATAGDRHDLRGERIVDVEAIEVGALPTVDRGHVLNVLRNQLRGDGWTL